MKIFVACSASNNIPQKYLEESRYVLERILKKNDLVFGAYYDGLMGMSHDIALKNGRSVIGVCTEAEKDDLKRLKCTKEITTYTVAGRTDELINESDVILFLPGGIGTMYELFRSLKSKSCNEFNKPMIVFNCCGFYDNWIKLMEQIYSEKFTEKDVSENYIVVNNKDDVIKLIERMQ
jgi:uncharacterized protein (TIGR00730 family)